MQATEFLARKGFDDIAPVLLFCPGKSSPRAREASYEPLLAESAVKRVVQSLVPPGSEDLGLTVFYADEANPGDIVLEAQTYPFLLERRVVIVRNAEAYNLESRADTILHYLGQPADTTVLIFVAKQIDRRLKFFKACDKAGWVVECPEIEDARELSAWVIEECKQRGKKIRSDAARALIDRAGNSLGPLRNACENLCNYVGAALEVTELDVVAASADVADEEVWTLTNAIAKSDTAGAVRALHRLLDLGSAPDALLGTLNWLLKTTYQVAVPEAATKPVPAFLAGKVRPLAEKLGRKKLIDAFALLTDTQFLTRTTGVDETLAMELLVIKLAAPRGGRRRT